MPRLGAHMSIAGGLPMALERARLHRCDSLQIFTTNTSRWQPRVLLPDEVVGFRRRREALGIDPVVAHATYLINLASGNPQLRRQSIEAFGGELDRAEALGLFGVVVHPGARTGGSDERALALVAEAIGEALAARRDGRVLVLLENTAGQGSAVGRSFDELGAIIAGLKGTPRVGVCLDTCHLCAAGYQLATGAGYRRTFDEFDRLIGLDRLKAFHVNDSKRPLGSRVDRHAHIGQGCVGIAGFRRLLNDPRFAGLPMIIETEKSRGAARTQLEEDPLDAMNLSALRSLLAAVRRPGREKTARRIPALRT